MSADRPTFYIPNEELVEQGPNYTISTIDAMLYTQQGIAEQRRTSNGHENRRKPRVSNKVKKTIYMRQERSK